MRRMPLSSSALMACRTVASSASGAMPVMSSADTSVPRTVAAASALYRSVSWPAVTSSPSCGPTRCARTLEVMVEDHRMISTCWSRVRRSGAPSASLAACRMSTKAIVTSCGVVSTLSETTWPSPETRPSVMVPPVSMSMLYKRCPFRYRSAVRHITPQPRHGAEELQEGVRSQDRTVRCCGMARDIAAGRWVSDGGRARARGTPLACSPQRRGTAWRTTTRCRTRVPQPAVRWTGPRAWGPTGPGARPRAAPA